MSSNEVIDNLIAESTPSPTADPAWRDGADADDGHVEALEAEHDRLARLTEGFFADDGHAEHADDEYRGPTPEYAELQREQQLAAQYQQREAQLHQQYQQAFQQYQQALQQQVPAVDFDSDPRAYVQAREQQFSQELQQLRGELAQHQQMRQAEAVLGQVRGHVDRVEADFRKATPDYDKAVEYAVERAGRELRQRFPGATDQQIGQLQQQAALAFVVQEAQAGRNPAASLYQSAKRSGFKSQPKLSAYERQVQQASEIDRMSPDEFEKFWGEMEKANRRGLR